MRNRTGRYSGFIRPFSYVLDLSIINLFSYLLLSESLFSLYPISFMLISWFIIAINVGFYEVYRFTKTLSIIDKTAKQFIFFTIICFAFSNFYSSKITSIEILKFTSISIAVILFFKLLVFYFLKKYRTFFGGNFRKVVVVGKKKNITSIVNFFNENPDYGYKLIKIFDLEDNRKNGIEECFSFIKDEQFSQKIDEIYCSLIDLSDTHKNNFIDFSDNNLINLKFLPDEKDFFSRNMKLDYYGYIPVISLRNISLDDPINQFIKRVFDIVFSLIVLLFFLSWLTPVLTLLIKIESKGPVFFKQKRNGLNYKEFFCYKFRSMNLNEIADIEQVSKNDPRITKIGKFIRKTSIDELPQFINVFLGDMSVVGPRPHMVSHTEMYAKRVDKFMVRHFIKPGITGLAQTNGYRGEVENEKDIIYRVKYDIFYVENWSILLDLKIVFLTVYNAVKGEEKAY